MTAALPPVLRGAALMPAAALLVHQLRYELAYRGDASRALGEQGHAYLSSLTPWLVLLAALALGASLGALVQRWAAGGGLRAGSRADVGAPRFAGARIWLLATLGLFAIYAGQELLEGAFAAGHASGVAAVVGSGGWWALPAAFAVGGALALLLRGGVVVAEVLDDLAPLRLTLRAALRTLRLRPASPELATAAPLARAAAGRAPPRAVVPTSA
ncbi:MAG TPA: hypothetical protein VLB76_08755 [Thermoanaerobaculia bacterium]|nr:hypothetical protein [Thermoanaerobaculia bacterium]